MKKYFLLLALFLLAGCTTTPDQNQKIVNPPESLLETQQEIPTQQIEQKSADPQTYSLIINEEKLTVELPISCRPSETDPSQFFDLKSKMELDFTDCDIETDGLRLDTIAVQDQESITAGIDNYIAQNGEEVCIDGPASCYKNDWNSERKIISTEKKSLQDISLPQYYDSNRLVGSYRYLVDMRGGIVYGELWRSYITYLEDKRIVITFGWGYEHERDQDSDWEEIYRKETDEFMKQVKMEMTLNN